MNDLKHIQTSLAQAIKRGSDVKTLPFIHATPALSVEARLHIYQDIRQEGMLDVLKAVYAVCRALTGEDFFDHMGRLFIAKTPAYSPDLGEYGGHFATFISEFEPAQAIAYLADVARLEWAWQWAFLKNDAPAFDVSSLGKLSSDQHNALVFKMIPSLSVINSAFPIEQIWVAHQAKDIDQALAAIQWQAEPVIIWRHSGYRKRKIVSESEARCLNKMKAGLTLGALSEETAIGQLPLWVQLGIIESCSL